ncbi:MAG TPA: NAD(P)H-dependent oxidoreductase subunit E [Desulfosarcina sp.]|nr:NAD(P)H-dependent oxidoreductase subunit E [Desulfosarcina sp.]
MKKSDILNQYAPRMENLLLILNDLQRRHPHNYLTAKDIAMAAGYLNTTLSAVYGVASYYSMFSLQPRGRHIIRICRSPVCDAAGLGGLLGELQRILGITVGETTPDRLFTLETAECLGLCDAAPAMMVDDTVHGNLTAAGIEAVIRRYGRKKRRGGATHAVR